MASFSRPSADWARACARRSSVTSRATPMMRAKPPSGASPKPRPRASILVGRQVPFPDAAPGGFHRGAEAVLGVGRGGVVALDAVGLEEEKAAEAHGHYQGCGQPGGELEEALRITPPAGQRQGGIDREQD